MPLSPTNSTIVANVAGRSDTTGLVMEPAPAPAVGATPEPGVSVATAKTPGSPDISVIVLNYNGAAWLDRCLTSLIAQTIAPRIEVIVADNASTDSSDLLAADLLQGRPGWCVRRCLENLGYCGGNNEASRWAKGQFLLFLNTDTSAGAELSGTAAGGCARGKCRGGHPAGVGLPGTTRCNRPANGVSMYLACLAVRGVGRGGRKF